MAHFCPQTPRIVNSIKIQLHNSNKVSLFALPNEFLGNTVVVAQLVESQFVVLVVVGSNPIDHPPLKLLRKKQFFLCP
jgi:hypothetical protein